MFAALIAPGSMLVATRVSAARLDWGQSRPSRLTGVYSDVQQILGACVAVSLLAACSSSKTDTTTSSTGSAAMSMNDPFANGAADKVFFDFDQAVIRDDARSTLDTQADWLNRNKSVNVQIAGDCDERGTEEYNIALGNRRALRRRELPRRQRGRAEPHDHHQLRQGSSDRPRFHRGSLGAEPQRHHVGPLSARLVRLPVSVRRSAVVTRLAGLVRRELVRRELVRRELAVPCRVPPSHCPVHSPGHSRNPTPQLTPQLTTPCQTARGRLY